LLGEGLFCGAWVGVCGGCIKHTKFFFLFPPYFCFWDLFSSATCPWHVERSVDGVGEPAIRPVERIDERRGSSRIASARTPCRKRLEGTAPKSPLTGAPALPASSRTARICARHRVPVDQRSDSEPRGGREARGVAPDRRWNQPPLPRGVTAGSREPRPQGRERGAVAPWLQDGGTCSRTPFDLGELAVATRAIPDLEVVLDSRDNDVAARALRCSSTRSRNPNPDMLSSSPSTARLDVAWSGDFRAQRVEIRETRLDASSSRRGDRRTTPVEAAAHCSASVGMTKAAGSVRRLLVIDRVRINENIRGGPLSTTYSPR